MSRKRYTCFVEAVKLVTQVQLEFGDGGNVPAAFESWLRGSAGWPCRGVVVKFRVSPRYVYAAVDWDRETVSDLVALERYRDLFGRMESLATNRSAGVGIASVMVPPELSDAAPAGWACNGYARYGSGAGVRCLTHYYFSPGWMNKKPIPHKRGCPTLSVRAFVRARVGGAAHIAYQTEARSLETYVMPPGGWCRNRDGDLMEAARIAVEREMGLVLVLGGGGGPACAAEEEEEGEACAAAFAVQRVRVVSVKPLGSWDLEYAPPGLQVAVEVDLGELQALPKIGARGRWVRYDEGEGHEHLVRLKAMAAESAGRKHAVDHARTAPRDPAKPTRITKAAKAVVGAGFAGVPLDEFLAARPFDISKWIARNPFDRETFEMYHDVRLGAARFKIAAGGVYVVHTRDADGTLLYLGPHLPGSPLPSGGTCACARGAQATGRVFLVDSLHCFSVGASEGDNPHQQPGGDRDLDQQRAAGEHKRFRQALEACGVEVLYARGHPGRTDLSDDRFPNNWAMSVGGMLALFPMKNEVRRLERRYDVITALAARHARGTIDYSRREAAGEFCEGTGSLVLDRANKVAYMCRSQRSDEAVAAKWAGDFGYTLVAFDASDKDGGPVYHTNVLMWIGTEIAAICAEAITGARVRAGVVARLRKTGREVVLLTKEQMGRYAGNCLEVRSQESGEAYIVMSDTAYGSLRGDQKAALLKHAKILHPAIPTIERCGGGSASPLICEMF